MNLLEWNKRRKATSLLRAVQKDCKTIEQNFWMAIKAKTRQYQEKGSHDQIRYIIGRQRKIIGRFQDISDDCGYEIENCNPYDLLDQYAEYHLEIENLLIGYEKCFKSQLKHIDSPEIFRELLREELALNKAYKGFKESITKNVVIGLQVVIEDKYYLQKNTLTFTKVVLLTGIAAFCYGDPEIKELLSDPVNFAIAIMMYEYLFRGLRSLKKIARYVVLMGLH